MYWSQFWYKIIICGCLKLHPQVSPEDKQSYFLCFFPRFLHFFFINWYPGFIYLNTSAALFQLYDGFTHLKKIVLLLIGAYFHYLLSFILVKYEYLRFFSQQYTFWPMLNCFFIYMSLSYYWFDYHFIKSPNRFIQKADSALTY